MTPTNAPNPGGELVSQVIEHPAYCPDCGGRACIETGPLAVHCGAEHDGGDPCDWRIPFVVEPGADVVLVATGSKPGPCCDQYGIGDHDGAEHAGGGEVR